MAGSDKPSKPSVLFAAKVLGAWFCVVTILVLHSEMLFAESGWQAISVA
jgi:hypothetical protein